MAETGMVEDESFEPVLLALIATGAPLIGGPTVLQVLWLVGVAVLGFFERRRLHARPPPIRRP